MTEPLCDLWELPVSQCACPKHRGVPDEPEPAPLPVGTPFPARYTGWCSPGDDAIEPGDTIVRLGRDQYAHERCVD